MAEVIVVFGGFLKYDDPSDIDVAYAGGDLTETDVVKIRQCALERRGAELASLPIDAHRVCLVKDGNGNSVLSLPILTAGETPLHVFVKGGEGATAAVGQLYDCDLSSILRACDGNVEAFRKRILEPPRGHEGMIILSLIPPGSPEYVAGMWETEMDRYCSGVKALRSAVRRIPEAALEEMFAMLNCGQILLRLIREDPVCWKNREAPGGPWLHPNNYGQGGSYGWTLCVSSDETAPCLRRDFDDDGNLDEAAAMAVIWPE